MVTVILLTVTYLAFLGRGMPDSITGAAWTKMCAELAVPESYISFITVTISLSTAVVSMISAKFIRRFGIFRVTFLSLIGIALTLLGYAFSHAFWLLCLLGVPLGAFAGGVDNALNDAMVHRKPVFLNVMHGVYGIGAALAPLLISVALERSDNWRNGYLLCAAVVCAISLIFGATFRLWKREAPLPAADPAPATDKKGKFDSRVFLICAAIFFTNGVEALMNAYGSTWLVLENGIDVADASKALMAFCLGMGFGRMAGGFLSVKVKPRAMIYATSVLLFAPVILLFFPLQKTLFSVLFFAVGFLNGPVYPLILYLTPSNFGEERSLSVMGTEIASAYFGFMAAQFGFGLILSFLPISCFPVVLTVLGGLMLAFWLLFAKTKKKV